MIGRAPYITVEGATALQAELKHLWKVKRPEVTRKVSEAAAMGDRSENAEYIYGKKQLRAIDRRIRYLSMRLDELVVVHRRPADESKVYFGAWVELESEAGETVCWRIVGADEIEPECHWISIDSPAARALVGRSEGDEIRIRGPESDFHWYLVRISYDALTDVRTGHEQ